MNTHYTATLIALRDATALALIATLAFFGLFIALEPSMVKGQVQSTFNITMEVDDEIAFVTAPVTVALTPTPSGLTGGTANGTVPIAVRSSATLGYDMTIQASSSNMVNIASSTQLIPAYAPASVSVPDYNFIQSTTGNPAQFAFSVFSQDDPADVAQIFKHNTGGGTCNDGVDEELTQGQCWLDLPTTELPIVERGSPTPFTGATTTLSFRVHIPNGPDPAVAQGNYRATSTITITNN